MSEINFEEIKKIVDSFPELPKRERSMIEIGGCQNDENVNSNYLAFFLKENEEHNLGRLFFDALLEVLGFKIDDYQGNYKVKREVTTKKGNRIDIVIQSEKWAIIIENKIYHYLNNDLQDYWDSVNVKNKKGVILSLKEEHVNYNEDFKNITHTKLIDEVKKNLGQKVYTINPKFLPFLQDFILNVENYYYDDRLDVKEINRKRLSYFFSNDNLDKKFEKEVRDYIHNICKNKLAYIGFETKDKGNTSHWIYYDENKNIQVFYSHDEIKSNNLSLRFSISKKLFKIIQAQGVELENLFESDKNIDFTGKGREIKHYIKSFNQLFFNQLFRIKLGYKGDNYAEDLDEIFAKIGENILPKLNELISKNK